MNLKLKNFSIGDDGLELEVRDGNTHRGDLIVTKDGVEWCRGRTRRGNGVKKTWAEFLKTMDLALDL